MKKSIHILVIALLTTSSIVSASTNKKVTIPLDSVISINSSENKSTKFVSYADANLVENEIASLKKHSKTIEEIIADDNKIIESAAPTKTSTKVKTLNRKKTIKN